MTRRLVEPISTVYRGYEATMMSLGRLALFSFIPGMFFGFATYFGRFGPVPRDPVAALGAVMLMNALGPAYAWLTARYGGPHHHAEEAHAETPTVKPVIRRLAGRLQSGAGSSAPGSTCLD